jgi:hypothetical protein
VITSSPTNLSNFSLTHDLFSKLHSSCEKKVCILL